MDFIYDFFQQEEYLYSLAKFLVLFGGILTLLIGLLEGFGLINLGKVRLKNKKVKLKSPV